MIPLDDEGSLQGMLLSCSLRPCPRLRLLQGLPIRPGPTSPRLVEPDQRKKGRFGGANDDGRFAVRAG